jgi:hypothetical protein
MLFAPLAKLACDQPVLVGLLVFLGMIVNSVAVGAFQSDQKIL